VAATCIFCGSNDMSKEHIWSDWLKSILPELAAQTDSFHFGSVFNAKTGVTHRTERTVPTTILETQVKRVCRTCNSGWMNDIELAAAAKLELMILGKPTTLSPDDQQNVATWIALKVLMNEFTYPQIRALTQQDHHDFHSSRSPLPNTTIWISPLLLPGDRWENRIRHTTGGLYDDEGADLVEIRPNTYATTAGIKHLLIHAFWTGRPDLVSTEWLSGEEFGAALEVDAGLLRIWPVRPFDVRWEPDRAFLASEDVWELSDLIIESLHERSK